MHRTRAAGRRLALEALEPRQLLAGNVSASLAGRTLRITGDSAANGIAIAYDASARAYNVIGMDAGGEITRINGKDTSEEVVSFSRVARIVVETRGGEDIVDLSGGDIRISNYLTIDTGEGNDIVTLGGAGNEGDEANLPAELRTGTSLNVFLGAGDDRLEMANLVVGFHLRVDAGTEDDEVVFATEFVIPAEVEEEADTILVSPVRVLGSLMIELGEGIDELDARRASVRGRVQITDAGGAADIALAELTAGGRIDIETSDEIDLVAIDTVRAGGLGIFTLGGADEVTIDSSRFRTMNVRLGSEFDELAISDTRTSVSTILDGEADLGLYTSGEGNVLRRLMKRRLVDA